MGKRVPSVPWYSDVGAVVAYYAKRVRSLARLADQASRYIFVRAEEVVEDPSRVFGAIEDFLGLGEPLREAYATFPHTGQLGWGDDSPAIRAGRIVRRREFVDGASLPEKTLAPATRAFEECCTYLRGGHSE